MAIEYKDIIRLEGTTLTLPSTCKAGQVGFESDGTKRMRREMVVDGVVLHWTPDEFQVSENISYSSTLNPSLTNVKLALDFCVANVSTGNDVITNNDFIFVNNYGSLRLENNEASIIMSADGSINVNGSNLQFNSPVNFNNTVGFGTSPSPWQTGYHALEFGKYGEIFANDTDSTVTIATNCYLNTSDEWIAKETAHSSRLVVGPDKVAIYLNQALTAGTEFFPDDDHRLILFDHEGRVTVKKSYIVNHDLETNNDDFGGWFCNYNGYAGMGVYRDNSLIIRGGSVNNDHAQINIDGTTGDLILKGNIIIDGTISGDLSYNNIISQDSLYCNYNGSYQPMDGNNIGFDFTEGAVPERPGEFLPAIKTDGTQIYLVGNSKYWGYIGGSTDARLSLRDNGGNETVRIRTFGGANFLMMNTGIGTQNPTEKLHVQGAIQVSDVATTCKNLGLKRTPFTPIMKPKVLNLANTDADLKGFTSGFTDGRYGYFVPNNNGAPSGKVARVDLNDFSTVSVLDLTLTNADLKGFYGGFTDGRYGYFVPHNNGAPFGKVARVDLNDFSTVSVLDLTLTDSALKGFQGGFTDGRYGYFVPNNNGAPSGKVARVDLNDFSTVSVLNLANTDADLKGFIGGFTDGRYGYFVPFNNSAARFGKVARVDLNDFSSVSVCNLTLTDNGLKGFIGGFTDGRYGYFVPHNNGAAFGKVARVDLNDFSTVSVLDLALTDVDLKGFIGGFTDGRYGYFVPFNNGAARFGKVARVDLNDFSTVTVLNLVNTDADLKGFIGGFTDGRYGYFVPNNNGAAFGKVARILLAQSCHINGSI